MQAKGRDRFSPVELGCEALADNSGS